MKSHFAVLWRYHYVITTATTFTTCDLNEKKIWISCGTLSSLFILLLRSLSLALEKKIFFIIFYYIHYAMVMSKRSKIWFQRYVRDAMIMKNIKFTLGFIKNTLIATTLTTPRSWQKSLFVLFQHYYIHYTVMMRKKFFFPCC